MNETNRIDKWLLIAATVLIFRIMLFVSDVLIAYLRILISYIPSSLGQYISASLPVYAPVFAIATALLTAPRIGQRMIQIEFKPKRILLITLVVLALLPWQLQFKQRTQAIMWDEMTDQYQSEMGLQQSVPGYDAQGASSPEP